MKKYVGMTSRNPYVRKQEWEQAGRAVFNFIIIHTGLTYDQAQALETRYRTTKGVYMDSNEGGPRKPGPVYSIYTYNYVE